MKSNLNRTKDSYDYNSEYQVGYQAKPNITEHPNKNEERDALTFANEILETISIIRSILGEAVDQQNQFRERFGLHFGVCKDDTEKEINRHSHREKIRDALSYVHNLAVESLSNQQAINDLG